ncbi:MAG: succinate dehydrogenase iron-sulfur subunit [Candidatus Eisenbacteria bacterium]|nr:succinate dehydrogenase iron-sulfur subunit [Candidatus Eisenbacteria bacterium]
MVVEFKVFRYDPDAKKEPYFDYFQVPVVKSMTVLQGLIYISENLDSTVAFRAACRAAVCGSCAMHINGEYRLACRTQIEALRSSRVTVRPLSHLPILKDLVVDMKPYFENYERIKPYLIPSEPLPEKEILQTPSQRKKIDDVVDCTLCGACYGSCPFSATNPEYLGPHAFMKTLRFVEDSRDIATKERLAIISQANGVFRCHTVFNCQNVCPKELDPSHAIARLKMKSVLSRIKGLFT